MFPLKTSFADDVWELYDLEEDFSQARDLANENPEKLRELQDLFWAEAAKNDVLPLSDSGSREGFPSLTADRDTFTYYAGAIGIPESGAPGVKNRSHVVTAEIDIPPSGAQGVLVAEGGGVAGWSLYIDRASRPVYTYNLFGTAQPTIVGKDALPSGEATVRFEFDYDGDRVGGGGTGTLYVNGRKAGKGRIERITPVFFSIDETFDIGTDTGSPVGDYPPHFTFTGRIHKVTVELK